MQKTYTLSYELPAGINDSLLIGAEYFENEMVQLSAGHYNPVDGSATVNFEAIPQKGNIIKFFYVDNLQSLTPLYPPKEITVK